jgi:hypothetical protein
MYEEASDGGGVVLVLCYADPPPPVSRFRFIPVPFLSSGSETSKTKLVIHEKNKEIEENKEKTSVDGFIVSQSDDHFRISRIQKVSKQHAVRLPASRNVCTFYSVKMVELETSPSRSWWM